MFFNYYEKKHLQFHKKYVNDFPLTKETNYLLFNDFYSFVLYKKQYSLSTFSIQEIDSLDIYNKLGINSNKLYKDSLLIKSNNGHLQNFLIHNTEYIIMSKTSFKDVKDVSKFPKITFDILYNSTIYSKQIKEYVLFSNLFSSLFSFGVTEIVDSLSNELRKSYPNGHGIKQLNDMNEKYERLLPGKKAPDFEGVTNTGKNISLSDFIGKVVLIDAWSTTCAPCRRAFPSVIELQHEFDSNEIVFIFISTVA